MANIMITKACNLRCTYCFANEYVDYNKHQETITLENFEKAMEFVTRTNDHIGLIGGEPLSHPQICEILDMIIENDKIHSCTVYTNGILLDKVATRLIHPKFSVLVNYNDSHVLSEKTRKRIDDALDTLCFTYYKKDVISLGINMYKPDFEYKHILDACKRYGKTSVRTSICVPNSPEHKNTNSLEWFKLMKPSVMKFFTDAVAEGIVPNYDCNAMPTCVFTEEEMEWVNEVGRLAQQNNIYTNLAWHECTCCPVIDILPDLSAVRCFGMSEDLKVNIEDFENITVMEHYMMNLVDSYKFLVTSNEECKGCESHKYQKCTGGCLSYKSKKIKQAREIVEGLEM